MKAFIAHSQTYEPVIPAQLHNYIVAKYVEKRKFQRDGDADHSYMYVTPRTLLGIIRLSQALAKLHFRHEVIQNDVDEAIRLMDFSFRSLQKISGNERERRRNAANHREEDKMANAMRTVRAIISETQQSSLAINEIFKRMRKHSNDQLTNVEELKEIMRYYAKMQVVYIDEDEQVSLL